MPENIKELIDEREKLKQENKELRQRLREANESIDAIRAGQIDALIDALVTGDKKEFKVFTEKTSDKIYRVLIEKNA